MIGETSLGERWVLRICPCTGQWTLPKLSFWLCTPNIDHFHFAIHSFTGGSLIVNLKVENGDLKQDFLQNNLNGSMICSTLFFTTLLCFRDGIWLYNFLLHCIVCNGAINIPVHLTSPFISCTNRQAGKVPPQSNPFQGQCVLLRSLLLPDVFLFEIKFY